MYNNTMEMYFAVAEDADVNFGFESLPRSIFDEYVNKLQITGSSHHGFIECVDSARGVYRFINCLLLENVQKGVLQYDRVSQDSSIHVNLLSTESDTYELCVGIAHPKYSTGHIGWFKNTTGYHFSSGDIYEAFGETLMNNVCRTQVLSIGDSIGLHLHNHIARFFRNGAEVYSVPCPSEFLPTITGKGCTFSVRTSFQ
jgi:hypothetical protein